MHHPLSHLEDLKNQLDSTLGLVKEFHQLNIAIQVFSRRDYSNKLSEQISQLEKTVNTLLIALQLNILHGISNINARLADAARRDENFQNGMNEMRQKLEVYLSQNQQLKLDELQYGRIISVMNQVADTEFSDGKWLQSAGDFQSFLHFLSTASTRCRLLTDFNIPGGKLDEVVEHVRRLALANMSQVYINLNSLPERFHQSGWHTAMKGLDQAQKRLSNLTLSVCFIGPAKAGKSTTISALLGCKLLPSDTFPCTVIPTIVRHVPKRKELVLFLPDALIAVLLQIKEDFAAHRVDLDCCKLTQIEKEFLDLALSKDHAWKFQAFEEFRDDTVPHSGIARLQKKLGLINHMFRINAKLGEYLRLKSEDGNIERCDLLQQLVRDQAWPVIEIEFEALRESVIIGQFQIVDTPGRDEETRIPAIKDIVTSVIRSSSAIVVVISSITAFTDAMETIRLELNEARRCNAPVFILSNRVDQLDTSTDVEKMELDIGRQFLNDHYNPSSPRQVFAVSSSCALTCFSVKKLLEYNADRVTQVLEKVRVVLDAVKANAWDSVGELPLSVEHATDICRCLESYNGKNKKWITRSAERLIEDLADSVGDIDDSARFMPFMNSLMKELAPQSGKKLVIDITNSFKGDLLAVINNLDDHIKLALLEDDAFALQITAVEKTIESINNLKKNVIPKIFKEAKKELDGVVHDAIKEIAYIAGRLLHHYLTELAQDSDSRIINGYKLTQFTEEEIVANERVNPYYRELQGKKLWEAQAQHKEDLKKKFNDYSTKIAKAFLDEIELNVQNKVQKQSEHIFARCYQKVADSAQSITSGGSKALQSFSQSNFKVAIPAVSMIPSIGKDINQRSKGSAWYTLYLFKVTRNVGTKYFVILEDYEKQQREVTYSAIESIQTTMMADLHDLCESAQDSAINSLESIQNDVRNQVNELKEERRQRHIPVSELIPLARTRVKLQGILMDLNMLADGIKHLGTEVDLSVKKSLKSVPVEDTSA